jgi:hypothetical protein
MLKTSRRVSRTQERHHYLFLCAVLNDASPATLRSYLDDECWDWEVLFTVASEGLILPLLYDRLIGRIDLQSGEISGETESEIANVLRDIRDRHAERNEIVLDELRVLGQLSNEIGIEPVALKGGALLLGKLYAAPSDRYMVDIDLLIPEPAIPVLVSHLLKNGYVFDAGNPVGVDCHHEMCIKRPGRPGVELHRSVGMGRAGILLPAENVIRDSVPIRHRGATLRLPSGQHLLLHQVLHAQLSHSYRHALWPSLREAYDCRLLVTRLSASGLLATLLQQCQEDKGLGIVALHLRTVQDLIGRPIPLPPLGVFTAARVQWLHRRLLRTVPGLRFIDPYFIFRSGLMQRLYRLKGLGKSRSGLTYVLQTPFRRSFYKNVLKELW